MAFNQLKETITELDEDTRAYLKYSESYLELKVFKILMRLVTTFFQTALIGSMLLLALFVMSIAVSYALGEAIGNTWYGFAIVASFFLVLAVLFYILRKRINAPLLRFFSSHYFL
ncbi:hypothetical protein OAA67_02780 [Winogradskyella sp.]|nr:hypothetical protein [Winogradskyella sp.]